MTCDSRPSLHGRKFRNIYGHSAIQVVTETVDAVQFGRPLHATGPSAGDAFAELDDLLIDGLNRPDS